MNALFLVPRGAEAAAVRRAGARVVALPAGARAGDALPEGLGGERIIVAGLCGALAPLSPETVVVYEVVLDERRRYPCDASPAAMLEGSLRVAGYTSSAIITSASEKRQLALRTGANVVDMEGTALAAALEARGIRFAMVRVVSDDANHDLPPLARAIDAGGTLRPERLALAFARQPFAALRLARDGLRALGALERVARALIAAPG
jgi:hypothetical protein